MTVTLWPLIALASCAIHFSVFALASRSYKQPTRFKQAIVADKARSWIVTGFTAPLVTLASLPFVYDLIRTGDIAQVARRPLLAMSTTVFFIAYLIWYRAPSADAR